MTDPLNLMIVTNDVSLSNVVKSRDIRSTFPHSSSSKDVPSSIISLLIIDEAFS